MHVKYKTVKTCLQHDGKAPIFFFSLQTGSVSYGY